MRRVAVMKRKTAALMTIVPDEAGQRSQHDNRLLRPAEELHVMVMFLYYGKNKGNNSKEQRKQSVSLIRRM